MALPWIPYLPAGENDELYCVVPGLRDFASMERLLFIFDEIRAQRSISPTIGLRLDFYV